MGDVASGLFALGGAVVGGVASWAGTLTEARNRRAEAARDRRDKLTETRRLLYSTFVERSDVVIDAARDVLSYAEPNDVTDESEDRYLEAWDQFVQTRAAVDIVGPPSAAATAKNLHKSVADVCNQVDAWLGGNDPWTDAHEERRKQLLDTRMTCRQAFVEAGQAIMAAVDGEA